jgi:hypothetical protein
MTIIAATVTVMIVTAAMIVMIVIVTLIGATVMAAMTVMILGVIVTVATGEMITGAIVTAVTIANVILITIDEQRTSDFKWAAAESHDEHKLSTSICSRPTPACVI